jgi:leader peptidase (prepilin peptidase) / N-methyltransferase
LNTAAAAVALVPGLAIGSFLNVVAVRVPERRSLLRPPSSCGKCGEEIGWRDNVPVLSYLVLRGHCRHCGAAISPLYPLVEATAAALIVACFAVFGATPFAVLAAGFCAVLVALTAIDLTHRIVPNPIVVPAALATLVLHTLLDPSAVWLAGSFGAAGFLFVAVLAYPKGLGMGDVKLALLLGAMLGGSVAVALLLGFVAALVPSAVLFARHGSNARKMAIPLVPFLALGAVVALFAGEPLLNAYLTLL